LARTGRRRALFALRLLGRSPLLHSPPPLPWIIFTSVDTLAVRFSPSMPALPFFKFDCGGLKLVISCLVFCMGFVARTTWEGICCEDAA
jgi:hypothetical protein